MSRLGKMPIPCPKNVEFKVVGQKVDVKGPKGQMSYQLPVGVQAELKEGKIFLSRKDEKSVPNKEFGLVRASVNNLIIGVSKGFEKKLTLIGVGYRANVQGHVLDLQVGFSHPTQVPIPKSVTVIVDKSTAIQITGSDKQQVGQFAAQVRAVKPPEPYKGKGIRYDGEYVRKKDGKAAKGKTA